MPNGINWQKKQKMMKKKRVGMWTDYLRLVLIVNSNEQENFKSKIKMDF
jgi:hypothetical protein